MEQDLEKLAKWIDPLIGGLSSAEQFKLAKNIGQKIRRSQATRIAQQKNPNGTPFEPKKKQSIRERAASRRGRIRRAMFVKMKTTRFLRVNATNTEIAVGFIGRVARIAREHQEGLRVGVNQGRKPFVTYPARRLLGLSQTDQEMIRDEVITHLENIMPK